MGTFIAAPQSPLTTGNTVVAVATGDLNNDGKLDIVAVNYNSSGISVLFGDGDGEFQAANTMSGMYQADTVAVEDFRRFVWLNVIAADLRRKPRLRLRHSTGQRDHHGQFAGRVSISRHSHLYQAAVMKREALERVPNFGFIIHRDA